MHLHRLIQKSGVKILVSYKNKNLLKTLQYFMLKTLLNIEGKLCNIYT